MNPDLLIHSQASCRLDEPQHKLVGIGDLEPPALRSQSGCSTSELNPRMRKSGVHLLPASLKHPSVFGIFPRLPLRHWSRRQESNLPASAYKAAALPSELHRRKLVDPLGIEPRPARCERAMLPLPLQAHDALPPTGAREGRSDCEDWNRAGTRLDQAGRLRRRKRSSAMSWCCVEPGAGAHERHSTRASSTCRRWKP